MNLKASFAAALLGLTFGAACSSSPKAAPASGVVETTTTTAGSVSFASCADAQAAGYHDIARGAPGYSARLDGDGDGVACDQKPKDSTFDAQAYCLDKLKALSVKYPKSFAGGDLAAECRKMLDQTAATSPKTIDALLETAETYYKAIG